MDLPVAVSCHIVEDELDEELLGMRNLSVAAFVMCSLS